MNPSLQLLVVDDEPATLEILKATLSRAGHSVSTVASGGAALDRLSKGDVDVALCDIVLPDMSGIEVMQQCRRQQMDTPFIMMTAFSSVDNAIEAMRAGAVDYMLKPLRTEELLHRTLYAARLRGLKAENEALKVQVDRAQGDRFSSLSPGMVSVERMVSKVARTQSTVLITGESGVGKSLIARDIHRISDRAAQSFVQVNCAAIPETLLESELFGHIKGAFTGADKARKGLFLEADRGSIFLDEIGELPLSMQVKLLHVLEAREVRPLGAEQARKIDVRIIAATNRDLPALVKEGLFREDLFYRLSGFQFTVPPLRERPEDIPGLVDHLLQRCQERLMLSGLRVQPDAMSALCDHSWPGNVRELENVLQRAAILAEDGLITLADLPDKVLTAAGVVPGQGVPELPQADAGLETAPLREQVRQFEMGIIHRVIAQCGGDRRLAAQRLDIGLSSLYRKLEESDETA